PCSLIYIGKNTGNPKTAIEFISLTIPPSATLGSFFIIVNPFSNSFPLFLSIEDVIFLSISTSRLTIRATTAPIIVQITDVQTVFVCPPNGINQLQRYAPKTDRPPA